MASYAPEFLAAVRHRYEDTDQPMRLIAAEFAIGITTLQKLVQTEGWAKRSERTRRCPPAAALVEDVIALTAAAPRAATKDNARTAGAALSAAAPNADAPLARVEAYLLDRIAAEQAAPTADAERSARTISILLRALKSLRELRGEAVPAEPIADDDDDDMPRDIDEFRRELARRINAFVDRRTVRRDAADGEAEDVDKA